MQKTADFLPGLLVCSCNDNDNSSSGRIVREEGNVRVDGDGKYSFILLTFEFTPSYPTYLFLSVHHR